jgi:hypothetical protein
MNNPQMIKKIFKVDYIRQTYFREAKLKEKELMKLLSPKYDDVIQIINSIDNVALQFKIAKLYSICVYNKNLKNKKILTLNYVDDDIFNVFYP